MAVSQGDLRAKIRELIDSGVLPGEPPSIERAVDAFSNRKTRSLIGGPLREPCSICEDEGPQVAYFYIGGRVARPCGVRRTVATGARGPRVVLAR